MSGPIPISLVAHTAFCPRRAWLEAQGEQVESVAIDQGVADHERVDARSDDRVRRRRSVEVHHDELGVTGRCDVVDLRDGVELVEFKSAPLRRSTQVTVAQRVQLALQGLCLEFMGHEVTGQSIYFTTARRSVPVDLTDDDRSLAVHLIDRTRDLLDAGRAPEPLEQDARCGRCSHASVCMPDEHHGRSDARRIAVAHPLAHVLHVTTPGSRASIRSGRLVVAKSGDELTSVPLERVQALVVHGNVDVSSALIRELTWHRRPVLWCSYRGQVIGFAHAAARPNGRARSRQSGEELTPDLQIAQEVVAAKIANQATQLRRNGSRDARRHALMRSLSRRATAASNRTDLLGVEGEAASLYFGAFAEMVRPAGAGLLETWPGRRGRGAGDELNVALNLVYGLLTADAVRALLAAGLDPHVGVLHSSSRNKPALALDLMEEFRPVVADSVVLAAINNGELRSQMFTRALGDARLRDTGRRALIACYERRVATEITHPVFGYRVSWRRAIEVQARLMLGAIDGTSDRYVGMRVR